VIEPNEKEVSDFARSVQNAGNGYMYGIVRGPNESEAAYDKRIIDARSAYGEDHHRKFPTTPPSPQS
jgi:hypothetical protein